MKNVFLILLILSLFAGTALAEGYNSFMDDPKNLGFFDQFAWDGLYVYWLHTPDDGSWADPPSNLYRMIPGGMEAELLLEGRRDNIAALELKPQANRTIALAVTEAGERSPATREFAEFVISRVKGIK